MTLLLHTRDELHALPPVEGPVVVVMTMGALHRGHGALIEGARQLAGPEGRVVVTDFVNPRQFGAGEDFERYPRDLAADLVVAQRAGADVLWAPDVGEIYRASGVGAEIAISPGTLGDELEGASRPDHFAGMLTVVAKLMMITMPDLALFGEKDYQQLVLIDAMVEALDLPVQVVGLPTVRDDDGVALSSRNRYLSGSARELARFVPRALAAGQAAAKDGAAAAEAAARAELEREGIDVDYVEVRDVHLGAAPSHGPARLLIAVRIDGVRLIDNTAVEIGAAVGLDDAGQIGAHE